MCACGWNSIWCQRWLDVPCDLQVSKKSRVIAGVILAAAVSTGGSMVPSLLYHQQTQLPCCPLAGDLVVPRQPMLLKFSSGMAAFTDNYGGNSGPIGGPDGGRGYIVDGIGRVSGQQQSAPTEAPTCNPCLNYILDVRRLPRAFAKWTALIPRSAYIMPVVQQAQQSCSTCHRL
jgi:hypothetical protein